MIDRKKERHEMGKVANAKLNSKVIEGNGMGQLFNHFGFFDKFKVLGLEIHKAIKLEFENCELVNLIIMRTI